MFGSIIRIFKGNREQKQLITLQNRHIARLINLRTFIKLKLQSNPESYYWQGANDSLDKIYKIIKIKE